VRLADFRVLTLVIILVALVAPASAGAQSTTPWGDPDLQGIWTNQTPVPLERPEGLAGKAFFTRKEAAAFEKAGLARLLGLTAAQVPFSGELNEIWLEAQDGRVPNRRTSLVIDPPDGRIPYTPEGRTRWDSGPTIDYQLSVTDPATFATTWTLENTLRRTQKPLFEVACHEGNYGLAGILSGARAQERDAARTGIR
jgi:hypothetical protein